MATQPPAVANVVLHRNDDGFGLKLSAPAPSTVGARVVAVWAGSACHGMVWPGDCIVAADMVPWLHESHATIMEMLHTEKKVTLTVSRTVEPLITNPRAVVEFVGQPSVGSTFTRVLHADSYSDRGFGFSLSTAWPEACYVDIVNPVRCDLVPGDRLLAINGMSTLCLRPQAAVVYLKQLAGDKECNTVRFHFQRQAEGSAAWAAPADQSPTNSRRFRPFHPEGLNAGSSYILQHVNIPPQILDRSLPCSVCGGHNTGFDPPAVVQVLSPHSNLLVGDIVLSLNGVFLQGLPVDNVAQLFRRPVFSGIELLVLRKVTAGDNQHAAGCTGQGFGPNGGEAVVTSFTVTAAKRMEALFEQVATGSGLGQTTNDFAEIFLHLAPSVYAHTVRFLSRTKLQETAQSTVASIITTVGKLAGGKQLNPPDLQPVWPRLRRLGLGLMEVEVVSQALQDAVRRRVLLDEVMLASWSCCEQAILYAVRKAFAATPRDCDLVTHSVYHPMTAPASLASGPGSLCSRYQERAQTLNTMASFNTEAARVALRSWRKVQAKGVNCGVEYFRRIFELSPAIREIFHQRFDVGGAVEYNTRLHQHAASVFKLVEKALRGIKEYNLLVPRLETLGAHHVQRHALPEHVDVFGDALLYMVKRVLGKGWTPKLEDAWTCCIVLVTEPLKQGLVKGLEARAAGEVEFNGVRVDAPAATIGNVDRSLSATTWGSAAEADDVALDQASVGTSSKASTFLQSEETIDDASSGCGDVVYSFKASAAKAALKGWRMVLKNRAFHEIEFCRRVFELSPAIRIVFQSHFDVSGPVESNKRLLQHAAKVFDLVSLVLSSTADSQATHNKLTQLGERHVVMGVEPPMVDVSVQALRWTVRQAAGRRWTSDQVAAWLTCMRVLAEPIKAGMRRAARVAVEVSKLSSLGRFKVVIWDFDLTVLRNHHTGGVASEEDIGEAVKAVSIDFVHVARALGRLPELTLAVATFGDTLNCTRTGQVGGEVLVQRVLRAALGKTLASQFIVAAAFPPLHPRLSGGLCRCGRPHHGMPQGKHWHVHDILRRAEENRQKRFTLDEVVLFDDTEDNIVRAQQEGIPAVLVDESVGFCVSDLARAQVAPPPNRVTPKTAGAVGTSRQLAATVSMGSSSASPNPPTGTLSTMV